MIPVTKLLICHFYCYHKYTIPKMWLSIIYINIPFFFDMF